MSPQLIDRVVHLFRQEGMEMMRFYKSKLKRGVLCSLYLYNWIHLWEIGTVFLVHKLVFSPARNETFFSNNITPCVTSKHTVQIYRKWYQTSSHHRGSGGFTMFITHTHTSMIGFCFPHSRWPDGILVLPGREGKLCNFTFSLVFQHCCLLQLDKMLC